MEITFITEYPCIRMLKQAYTLKKLGYTLHLIFGGPVIGPLTANESKLCKLFKSIRYFKTKNQLSFLLQKSETNNRTHKLL